ncbi:unnamed protein product, partial [marine sediment metagenome]
MAVIDIGNEVIDRDSYIDYGKTLIDGTNPANASGRLTSVSIYARVEMLYTNVAIFYRPDPTGYPNNFTARDSHYVGTVAAGEQSFEVELEVEAGDFIGVYFVGGGQIECDVAGGTFWNRASDETNCD